MSAEERVAAGATWLDAHAMEGWRERIDVAKLDMRSSTSCILGQLAPKSTRSVWWSVKQHWGFHMFASNELHNLGFTNTTSDEHSWELLTEAWRKHLETFRG